MGHEGHCNYPGNHQQVVMVAGMKDCLRGWKLVSMNRMGLRKVAGKSWKVMKLVCNC